MFKIAKIFICLLICTKIFPQNRTNALQAKQSNQDLSKYKMGHLNIAGSMAIFHTSDITGNPADTGHIYFALENEVFRPTQAPKNHADQYNPILWDMTVPYTGPHQPISILATFITYQHSGSKLLDRQN